ncbi:MAG: tetratricopeptide repeat protein [Spirochaetes bacterium]|nr:tetratricopeptide repeat protein [Spirochaetota bacterium]
MNKIISFIFISLILITVLNAQPATIIQKGAPNSSLGDTGAGYYSGVSSIFYNPAALFMENYSVLNFQADLNKLNSYYHYSLGYIQPFWELFVVGFSFSYFKLPEETREDPDIKFIEKIGNLKHIANAALSSRITKEVNFGLNLKVINNSYDKDSYMGISMDFGVLYTPIALNKKLSLGANVMNFVSTKGELGEEEIKEPMNVKIGTGYDLDFGKHSIFLALDFNSEKVYFPEFSTGIRYSYADVFELDFGYNEDVSFTSGSGFRFGPYKAHYAYIKSKDNNIIHQAGISYYFRPKLDEDMMEKYYNKAIGYYNDFKFLQSYRIFKDLYRADSNYRETTYYYELLQRKIGATEIAQGKRLEQAEELYEKALIAYKKERYSESRNALIECLKKNVKHPEARSLLKRISEIQTQEEAIQEAKIREKEGDYYFSLNQYASSLIEYNSALKLDPENKLLKLKIFKVKNKLGTENTSALGYKLYKEGKNYFEGGEYTKAISKWEEALIALPDFTLAKLEIEKVRRIIREQEEEETSNRMFDDQTENLFKVADYNFTKKNYVQALFQIESILEIDPKNSRAIQYKARILSTMKIEKINDKSKQRALASQHLEQGMNSYRKNDFKEALYHFGKVIALNPEKSSSIKELSSIFRKMSEMEAQGINKDSPNFKLVELHYERGMKYFKRNNYEQAAAEWKRVFNINPADTEVISRMNDAMDKARKEKEEKLAKFHLKRAMKFLEEGKKDLAVAEAKRILAILPDNEDAKDIITKSISGADRSETVNSYLEKAVDLFNDGKYAEAIQEIRLVLTIEPGNKLAQKRLVEYNDKLKEIEQKNQVVNYIDMAEKYYDHENYSMARNYINKTLSIDKQNAAAIELSKKIDNKELDVEVTEKEKNKLVEIFNTGLNQFLEGKYDDCIKNMKKVLIINPDNIQALKFVEKAKAKIQEQQSAAVEPKGKIIDKKLVWSHYLKGINYYTMGDIENAIKSWREALRIDPNNAKIRRSLSKALVKQKMLR